MHVTVAYFGNIDNFYLAIFTYIAKMTISTYCIKTCIINYRTPKRRYM